VNQVEFNELQQWLHSQQALWQQMLSQNVEIDAAAIDWQPLLDACHKLAEQQGAGLQSELADAMAAQTRAFCRYGLGLLKQLREPDSSGSVEMALFTLCQHLHEQAQRVLLRQWQLPELLARLLADQAPQAEALNPFGVIEQLLRLLAQHSKQQRVVDLAAELQCFNHALLGYRERLQQLHRQVSQQMLTRTQGDTAPQSLAQLHDLWVECYEHAYQRMLQRSDYQRLYGELTNASLRLQQLGRAFWREEYRQAGLVPQQDYDQLLQQHHQLRKELRHSRRDGAALAERLSTLAQSLEQIRVDTDLRLAKVEGSQVALVRKRKA